MPFQNRLHRPPRGLLRILTAASFGVVLGGCTSDLPTADPRASAPERPALALNPACDDGLGGTVHTEDSITSPATWTRAGNPHRTANLIAVAGGGRLVLEPGVVVCFGDGAGLGAGTGGRIRAVGLDTARITLTARDPVLGWYGLGFSGTPDSASLIRNAVIEHVSGAISAIRTHERHVVLIDSTTIRHAGRGVWLNSPGSRISRSRVDTTSYGGLPAVALWDSTGFEKTVVTGAAGMGLAVYGDKGIVLLGGRVLGSAGVGLLVNNAHGQIVSAQPIRVTGGASYPAALSLASLAKLYPALADQDSLLGNARDTLQVLGYRIGAWTYARGVLPWHVVGTIIVEQQGIVRIQPGGSIFVNPNVQIIAENGGRLVGRGTKAFRARITARDTAQGWGGIVLDGAPSVQSVLVNTDVEYVKPYIAGSPAVHARGSHPLHIDSAVFRHNTGSIKLESSGSRISRSRVDSTRSGSAVDLRANALIESTLIRGSQGGGLVVSSATAQVVSCDIQGSAYDGIALIYAVAVHDCNLSNNGYHGIINVASTTADAENVWWGDAAGPTGPGGDGVYGPVDYTPWRTTPFTLPYVP